MSLEDYARERKDFRARVMALKKIRSLPVGEHVMLMFENELTVRYQIQEMLRIERIFEDEGINGELAAYNPLVPDGSNWKATMMIEFPLERERRHWLARLAGIENCVWARVAGCERVVAIADEDLPRGDDDKTSAVHFLRFELDQGMVQALRHGARLCVGVDHPEYAGVVDPVPAALTASLCGDLID
ncbi:MAG: DUF3501 family protein [Rhodocyclales bacterium]|nr:DUF3501 family protein [Rhodocyclales bacterium]